MLGVVIVSLYALTHRVNITSYTHTTHSVERDGNGWTPLHYACFRGHLHVVKYLVEEAKCNTGELIIL